MSETNPFFAIDAELLLKSKLFDKAISICKNGLAHYPLYFSGWKLLIEIYKSAGNIDEAITTADYALTIFPNNSVLKKIKNELQNAFNHITFNNIDIQNEKILGENHEYSESRTNNFKNNLHEIAKKLDEVSSPATSSEVKIGNLNFQSGIITETIAKIYISQGAFSEAISAYRQLIKNNPSKENYYLSKIAEIESR